MQDFILVLAYLIIAMIAFAAPVIIFLLSVNSEGIQIAKEKAEIQKRELLSILASEIGKSGVKVSAIGEKHKQLKKSEQQNKERIDRLTPKIQITKISTTLFLSLLFIMADMIVRDNVLNLYSHYLSISLIILSIITLMTSIYFIKLVAWEIISTKQTIEEEKMYLSIGHSQIATGQQELEP